jgi:hypothetical protein
MRNGTILLIALLLFSAQNLLAQDEPVGYWRSHLPYNTAVSVASDGITMYVISEQSFYTYNLATGELTPYSKVEGMSDVAMTALAYDDVTGTTILAYKNSNIDLFKDGNFFNLPDLKLKNTSSTKKINNIYTEGGLAYLSSDVGIIVINLDKKEVKETYSFTKNSINIPVKAVTSQGSFFYAITDKGMYRANKNSPNLQAFTAWVPIDTSRYFNSVLRYNDNIYVSSVDTVFAVNNMSFTPVYISLDSAIINLDSGTNGFWVCEGNPKIYRGRILKFNTAGQATDSVTTEGFATKVVEHTGGVIWIADKYNGLVRREGSTPAGGYTRAPLGPNSFSSFDIYAHNKEVLVAHGGFDQFYIMQNSGAGFAHFKDEYWLKYELYKFPPFGGDTYDFIKIIKGPDGNIYAGSTQSGLFILKPDGSYESIRENSFLDSGYQSGGHVRVHGLAFDKEGNLWINVFMGQHELAVRTKEGVWYEYYVPFARRPFPNGSANIIVDENNLKWYSAPGGGGLIVYDDNGTIDNPADDKYRQLLTGEGTGNLPDNEVYCIAEDKNGAIWFGTGNGVGIINCPSDVIAGGCEAELRIVQYDKFPGYLFQNEVVRALAVDGANRKWIGTNNGVWLISADGNSIISRFTEENSPLPSNLIQKITIDAVTGDVYIGTEQGLVSYRGTAIDGGSENSNVTVFPNPVSSGYNGPIAIKGLVENADVRITDISGQLVHRTRALGGQAIWNGMDYSGRRPQSGVYLVFITNRDGSQTHVGKLVFME